MRCMDCWVSLVSWVESMGSFVSHLVDVVGDKLDVLLLRLLVAVVGVWGFAEEIGYVRDGSLRAVQVEATSDAECFASAMRPMARERRGVRYRWC